MLATEALLGWAAVGLSAFLSSYGLPGEPRSAAIAALLLTACLLRLDARPRRRSIGFVGPALLASTGLAAIALKLSLQPHCNYELFLRAAAFSSGIFLARALQREDGRRRKPHESPLGPMENAVKRFFDLAIVLLAALPVVATLLVLRTCRSWPHGFLFRQVRTGRHGRLFLITKLRTMTLEAESDGRPRWSEHSAGETTPFGARLRARWIDELPQLWDVLRGRMSLVGPRPERPEFVEGLALRLPKYARRLTVLPGITGTAQVSGFAGDTSLRRRLACDRWYVRHWSPWTDFALCAATLRKALRRAASVRP